MGGERRLLACGRGEAGEDEDDDDEEVIWLVSLQTVWKMYTWQWSRVARTHGSFAGQLQL